MIKTKRILSTVSAAALALVLAPGLAFATSDGEDVAEEPAPVAVESVADEDAVAVTDAAAGDAAPAAVEGVAEGAASAVAEGVAEGVASPVADGVAGANVVQDPGLLTAVTVAADSPVETVADAVNEMIDTIHDAGDADAASEGVVSDVVSKVSDAINESGDGEDADADADADADDVSTQADEENGTLKDNTLTWKTDPSDTAKSWYSADEVTKQHGTAELVSVEVDGKEYTAAELAKGKETDKQYYLNGVLCAPADSVVTMKFLPERGYQLIEDTICGGEVAVVANDSADQIGVYTFDMPANGLKLECPFSASEDIVESESPDVPGGKISGATEAAKNGTLNLTILDMENATAKTNIAAKAVKPADVVAYLDLSLSNMIYQGADGIAWETPLTELPSAITLTLNLSDEIAGSSNQFYIIREHNGEYQQAEVTFDASTKSITFKTDKFSNYAIAKGTLSNNNGNNNNNNNSSNNSSSNNSNSNSNGSNVPKTGDTNNPMALAVSAACSAVVAAFALRRLRREN